MKTINQRNRDNRRRGRENERQLQKKLKEFHVDSSLVPSSGAIKGQPGDLLIPDMGLLIEAKSITAYAVDGAKYVRINLEWLTKARKQAREAGLDDGIVIFRVKNTTRYYVIQPAENYFQQATSLEKCEEI